MTARKSKTLDVAQLSPATVTENDPKFGRVTFATGKPVEFTFARNTEKSGYFGGTYGQDVEPTGIYMIHVEDLPETQPRNWIAGTIRFAQPLVLAATTGARLYDEGGWKARLHRATGLKGRALSRYLLSLGYDAVVTVQPSGGVIGSGEIIALRP